MNQFDRFIRTVIQVARALAVVWPTAVIAFGQPVGTTGLILAVAAAAVVLVNGLQNVVLQSVPGPWRRWVRTVAAVVLGAGGAAPAVLQAVGDPTDVNGWIVGVFAGLVVLDSAIRNRLDAVKASS